MSGPVVKWYNAAFALLKREFDSPRVHHFAPLSTTELRGAGINVKFQIGAY